MDDHIDEVELLKQRIAELETVLQQAHKGTIATTFRLPPNLARLMGLLMALPRIDEAIICERLGIATVGKVAIWRLRKLLEPYGIVISSKRCHGWWLEPAAKERAQKFVDGELTLAVTTPELRHSAEEPA
jgi:hypothetical protein